MATRRPGQGGEERVHRAGAVISQAELRPDLGMESMVSEFGGSEHWFPNPHPAGRGGAGAGGQ